MKDTQLLICDWSGVISDDRKVVYEAQRLLCKKFRLESLPYEEWLSSTKASAFEWFAARGVKLTRKEILACYEEKFLEVQAKGMQPSMYPDAVDFLKRATVERTSIVVSTHPQDFLHREAKEYGLDHFFKTLHGGSPNKTETILGALREHQISECSAMMVGDTRTDIRYAKAAGVKSVGITTGYHSRDQLETEKPDLLVSSLTELAEYF